MLYFFCFHWGEETKNEKYRGDEMPRMARIIGLSAKIIGRAINKKRERKGWWRCVPLRTKMSQEKRPQ